METLFTGWEAWVKMYNGCAMKQSFLPQKNFAIVVLLAAIGFSGRVWAQGEPTAEAAKPAANAAPAPRGNVSSETLTPKIFERFDTPSIEGSNLKLASVLPGDVDTIDNVYTHEVTRVLWRPGDPIDLYIVKPVGVKNPPVILYLYSYPFEMDRFLDRDFCKFLVKDGYAAIGFASALTSHRYHDRPMKEWFVSEMAESLATTTHDVQMILDYLNTRGDLDLKRVGMFGDGSGATIAILAAAADPRIKTLDLLDPWGDWPDWAAKSTRIPEDERPNFLKPEWQKSAGALDPVKWLPKLTTLKMRVQFIKSVSITPAEVQKKIEATVPPNAQIVHYDDAAAFKQAVAGGTGFDWIKDEMKFRVVGNYSSHPSQAKAASKPQDNARQ
jgi:hypothetical protein